MLFYLKFTNHDIEKLHQLMSYFFERTKVLKPTSFDSTTLLPAWYNTTPIFKMDKLETLLTEFIGFDAVVKNKIIDAFNNTDDVQKLFEDTTRHIDTAQDFNNVKWKTVKDKKGKDKDLTIADFLSELFVYLYKNQLGSKGSPFCKKIKSDLSEFYHAFVKDNAVDFIENMVCPYCGLEKMRDSINIRKPDHDHLLPKGDELFVFSSVNSKNLFPSGTDCNIIKDTEHLLYSDNLITRCTAFYPYSPIPHPFQLFSFKLFCNEIPSFSNSYKGKWTIEIQPNDPLDSLTAEKIESWDRVFKIKNRYATLISNSNKSLIDKELNLTKIKDVDDLITKLKNQRERLPITYFMLSTETEVVPRRIFYDWATSEISYLKELMSINATHISGTNVDLNF